MIKSDYFGRRATSYRAKSIYIKNYAIGNDYVSLNSLRTYDDLIKYSQIKHEKEYNINTLRFNVETELMGQK